MAGSCVGSGSSGSGTGSAVGSFTGKAIASEKCKEILYLMDTDKNSRISRQERMKFLETEFDRLDTTKKGEINPKKLLKSNVSLTHVRGSDVGK